MGLAADAPQGFGEHGTLRAGSDDSRERHFLAASRRRSLNATNVERSTGGKSSPKTG